MALVGGLNYISALVGLLNATLSAKLYGKFGGPQGAVKVIVLIVCVLFAVFAGTLGVFFWQSYDLYKEFILEFDEVAVRRAYKNVGGFFLELMKDPEGKSLLAENIGMGPVFAAVGCFGVIFGDSKSRKAKKAAAEENTADWQ